MKKGNSKDAVTDLATSYRSRILLGDDSFEGSWLWSVSTVHLIVSGMPPLYADEMPHAVYKTPFTACNLWLSAGLRLHMVMQMFHYSDWVVCPTCARIHDEQQRA